MVSAPFVFAVEEPIAWWPLDGDLGDTVGGIKLTPTDKPEFSERAMMFGGKTQFLSAGDVEALNMGRSDFTLEATFKLSRYPKNHAFIIGKGDKGIGGFYYLAVVEIGYLRVRIHDGGDTGNQAWIVPGRARIELNKWYHVIAAYDRDRKLSVYVNGLLTGYVDISKVGDIDNAGAFYIGMLWSQHFPGKIADVRIYRRALSRSEAKEQFKAAVTRKGYVFAGIDIADDSRFSDWKKVSEAEARKVVGITKGNLLGNSSFEGLAGVGSLINGPKWWAKGGSITRHGGWHGSSCVRGYVMSDPIPYRPGIPHTLSFYAKASRDGLGKVKVRHTHRLPRKFSRAGTTVPELTFDCKLTGEWQRFSFSFSPGAYFMAPIQHFILEVSGSGKPLFDAFQLEHGGLTEYAPKPLELFVNMPRRKDRCDITYFFAGEKVPVRAVATKQGPAEVAAGLTVRDFWLKPVHTREINFKIAEGTVAGDVAVTIPALPKGCYRVYLESGDVKARSIIFGVIGRDLREPAEIMGASHGAGMDYNARFTDDFGITWTRDHAAYWGPSSSRPEIDIGHPDFFKREDGELAQKRNNPKLRYWASLNYCPRKWDKYNTRQGRAGGPVEEAFLRDMGEHMRAMVAKYGRTVKYWECWNEPLHWPPSEYLKNLKIFYKAVKETDPNASVIGFSGFLFPESWDEWMVPLIRMGALKYCDILSYHGYFFVKPDKWKCDGVEGNLFGVRPLSAYLDFIRAEAAKVGKDDMPIWDDEFTLWGESWYVDERPRAVLMPKASRQRAFDCRRGVSQIVKYVTIGYAHGVRHFGPHCFTLRDSEQNQHRVEFIQPAMDYDGSIKPKTIAFSVVCHKMNGAKLVDERVKGNLYTYVFSKPKGSLAVVFTRHGKPATLELLAAEGLTFRDVFDAPFAGVTIKGKGAVIALVGEPVYIESTRSGDALARALKGLRMLQAGTREDTR